MDEPLFIVENLAEYKSNLEADEDVICAWMSKGERKAYQMGVQNMYAILQDVIEYDSSKGNYNIFVPENIHGEEFDLSDFVKWDAKRNKDKFDRKSIKIVNMSNEENKACIVTSGEYSDYHINKTVYDSLYKTIFTDGKMTLSPEIDSCDFHAMNHKDTEILGMFLDVIRLSNVEDLKRILIKGYVALMQERSHKLSSCEEK